MLDRRFTMVYCSKCGGENEDDAVFCVKCGIKLEIGSETDKAAKAAAKAREAREAKAAKDAKKAQEAKAAREARKAKPGFVGWWYRQSRNRKLIIAFASIFIIIMLLIFANEIGVFSNNQHYEDNNVSFDYVTGWIITKGDGNASIVTGKYDSVGQINFSVVESPVSEANLDGLKIVWENGVTSNGAKIKSTNQIKVDGTPAYAIDYTSTVNKTEMQNYAVIFIKNSSSYVLLFTTETNLHEYRKSINTIIDSFHVK